MYIYIYVAPRVRVHKGRETGTNQFRGLGSYPKKGNPLTGLFTVTPWAQYELVTLLDTWLPTAAASSLLHLTCLEPCAVAMAKSVISPGSLQVAYGSYIQGYSIHTGLFFFWMYFRILIFQCCSW